MGEKDITEKILEDHNDVFADIINALVFAGEQKILAESLENTAVHSQYKADDEKVHELERDIAKYWKDGEVELAICGIENQSSVEKYMPFRVMEYDGTAYRSQLQKSRKEILPRRENMLHCSQIIWKEDSMGEKEGRNTRVLSSRFS